MNYIAKSIALLFVVALPNSASAAFKTYENTQPWLYLSAYFEAYRKEYYDHLLAVSQTGAWEAWLDFFLKGIHVQAEDAVAQIQRLQQTRHTYHDLVKNERAADRLIQAIDVLLERPILSIRQLDLFLHL